MENPFCKNVGINVKKFFNEEVIKFIKKHNFYLNNKTTRGPVIFKSMKID